MSESNNPSKRPRRRRRSNRDRPRADAPANTGSPAPDTTNAEASNTPSGYSNQAASPSPSQPQSPPQNRSVPKPRQGQKPRSGKAKTHPVEPGEQSNAKTDSKSKPKRKKPRTKTCFNCYTPCLSLFRVQADYTGRWKFVCDICWDTVAEDNPHYKFGGVWPPPRQARSGGGGKGGKKPTPPNASGQPKPH